MRGEREIKELEKKEVWKELRAEYEKLKNWLKGPDVPVFILLSDSYNRTVQEEYNGRAGIIYASRYFYSYVGGIRWKN